MASAIDWKQCEQLKAQGLADREIAWCWGIPRETFHRAKQRHTAAHPSPPIGTPRQTQKKTYVLDTLYVDLIERYAQAEGVELKDVVTLAFHEFFERRKYLPLEG